MKWKKMQMDKKQLGQLAPTTAQWINLHPPMTTRTEVPAPAHAICKVCAINLEMVRDVSIIVSVFLNKELVPRPQPTRFNLTPSSALQRWSESHTLLERMPMAVRQPPARVSLPGEGLPGQKPTDWVSSESEFPFTPFFFLKEKKDLVVTRRSNSFQG